MAPLVGEEGAEPVGEGVEGELDGEEEPAIDGQGWHLW